ncbi:aminotransferase class I/II-fold pyridoxal phosphate-dependent enzyme [Coraliomargarita parva]|uniref:aminotransferase class I/II-fold pyridoxal phosphate-dependent enzyme n=1 Tax=Coraliomargarita parva TaxID=3014050 RepID=UPI0022B2BF31|nr:aminotransferase class I/II-fold pyridoxal phosphate-dependent enzyme [Coraliomargarita parva]
MKTYFVTANDTDVGKTYVMGLLARHFSALGQKVQIVKALECGASGDAERARQRAGAGSLTTHTLMQYPQPLAPLASGNAVDGLCRLETLVSRLAQLPPSDVRLIEGAGGLAVPIDPEGLDWRDFIDSIEPEGTIVVIDQRLGAINQGRLLEAYLGKRPHAFVLNERQPADKAVSDSNLEAYHSLNMDILATVRPNGSGFDRFNPPLLPAQTPVAQNIAPEQELSHRRQRGTLRRLRVSEEDRSILNLADNDYLGLRHHPDVIDAAVQACRKYGTSASASPLVTGYTAAHASLESAVSEWYGQRPCLIWNSGYAANQSVLKCLVQKDDLILADRLIHNSLIHGILQSGARLIRFPHNNLDCLESLLHHHAGRKIHVVTESLYSMDGDSPDLQRIARLKAKYGFNWYLDEAHAIGWFGESGSGLAEAHGVSSRVDVLTGTLGKALAASGAYTVFSEDWMRDYCINMAGEFIYSTYLPPSSVCAAEAAIRIVRASGSSRRQWQAKAYRCRERLRLQGWEVWGTDAPILPVICDEVDRVTELSGELLQAGIRVAAIRPPTVPAGTARLRLSLKSTLDTPDYDKILSCFERSVLSRA